MSKGGGMRSWLRHEGRYSIESVFPQKWTGWRVWKPFIKHGFQRMPKRDVWFLAFGLVLERQVTNHSLRSWKLNVWKLPDVWFQGCCWVVVWPIFFFIPKIGEMIPILTHIFQRGWFNHQLRLSLKQTLLWLHVASLAPLRMKAAIFLDQTCRNYLSMQRGSQVAEANQFKALCDSVALRLALSVLVDIGFCESNFNNGDLLKLGSIPEICFLSLVLRHAREPFSLKLSETMLLAVLRELSDAPATNSQKELCTRFLEETQDAIQSIVVEAYLEKALSTDKPVELAGKPDVLPRVSVLDSRMSKIWNWCSRELQSYLLFKSLKGRHESTISTALFWLKSFERSWMIWDTFVTMLGSYSVSLVVSTAWSPVVSYGFSNRFCHTHQRFRWVCHAFVSSKPWWCKGRRRMGAMVLLWVGCWLVDISTTNSKAAWKHPHWYLTWKVWRKVKATSFSDVPWLFYVNYLKWLLYFIMLLYFAILYIKQSPPEKFIDGNVFTSWKSMSNVP